MVVLLGMLSLLLLLPLSTGPLAVASLRKAMRHHAHAGDVLCMNYNVCASCVSVTS
jgi:hypothetical protein